MESLSQTVARALAEDIGPGDITASFFTPPDALLTASLVARVPCTLAGLAPAAEAFRLVDPTITLLPSHQDGDALSAGTIALRVAGPARSILTAERTALNFLQRLSGIATLTRAYVDAIADTGVRLLDTRKTTPGLRLLEKQAVLAGGAANHRMGLYDMAMIKDNHIAAAGGLHGLPTAIQRLKAAHPHIPIEVEVDSLSQLETLLPIPGIDVILLDNMPSDSLRKAVTLRNASPASPLLEASGGISLDTIREIALTGIDFISIGAITHSAPAIDLALDFLPQPTD